MWISTDMDILLTGGQVIDGTGSPAFPADVAIKDGRVEALLDSGIGAEAAETIDVSGCIVSPGFIDVHSHSDFVFALPPERQRALLEGRIRQGITSEIVGNCGLGRYPSTSESSPLVEGICGFFMPDRTPSVGHTIAEYLDYIGRQGVAVNVGTLVPHGPIRFATSGPAARGSTPTELHQAEELLKESLEAGAFGLSLGLIYPPGLFTPTAEIVQLARCVARFDGIVTFHQRSGSPELLDNSINEILEVGRCAEAHVHISHEHAQGRETLGGVEKLLEWSDHAERESICYTQDVIPYTVVQTTLLAVYPPWTLAEGVAGWLKLARDPDARSRMRREIETKAPVWPPWIAGNWATNIIRDVGYAGIRIAECGHSREKIGMSLSDMAEQAGDHPFEAMTDLLLASDGQVTMSLDGISGTRDDDKPLRLLVAHPTRAIVTDAWDVGRGTPHAGAYGAFPKVFRRYVRELELLTLPEAIRKLTSLPASIFGIKDRGVLEPGAHADIVVFRPEKILDRATEQSPRVFAEGIDFVFVNGRPLISKGDLTNQMPGSVLRHNCC